MSLEDEPTASEPSGDLPPAGDPPPAVEDDLLLPSDLPAPGPPRNTTSRADKRRNQRR
ncbi:hypothetical protein [Asanoa ishikariensis]|uniref:hypothetical protein n=1 Tax=Asanoa ishikariensis TaxID=137265 RepID=UPI0015A1C1B4|nr:hypothetical protein [Asanoa ishikariensis]